jgi:GTP-binding protein HflX
VTKEGIDELIKRIGIAAEAQQTLMKVLIPFTRGDLVSFAHKRCSILSEEYTSEGTLLDVRVSPEFCSQFQPFIVQ